jgi:hypothetical protein
MSLLTSFILVLWFLGPNLTTILWEILIK